MAGNTCFLCGDKLVNGYCTSCGFSNKRAQKIRYRLNPSESVEQINGERYKKSIIEQTKDAVEKQRMANTSYQKRTNRPKSTAQNVNSFKAVLAIIAILLGLFAGPIGSIIRSIKHFLLW